MILDPTFTREAINPSFVANADIGELFQRFVLDLLQSERREVYGFLGVGRDGAIDLLEDQSGIRAVVECKFIGESGLQEAQARWRKTAKNLTKHVAGSSEPLAGQKYAPWFRSDLPISKYLFVVSSVVGAQADIDELQKEIQEFFRNLGGYSHLSHLAALRVEVLEWSQIQPQLRRNPGILFLWFPSQLVGFSVLKDFQPTGGFRSYLGSAKLPYLSRQKYATTHAGASFATEEALIAGLESGTESGIIITGIGGAGKTRLTLELGRVAQTRDWLVIRAKSRLKVQDVETLAQNLANKADQRVLVLVDYVETQRGFADFIERLNELNDDLGLRLRYVANCRNSYYASIATTPRHHRLDLSSFAGQTAAGRERLYREEVVRHILKSGGFDADSDQLRLCDGLPILAVFLFFLKVRGRQEQLQELLKEQDFEAWIAKRIELSFPDHSPVRVAHDLALLIALFPVAQDIFQRLLASNLGSLLQVLQQDDWVERVQDEEGQEVYWSTPHDVFADGVLRHYVRVTHADPSNFAVETIERAREFESLRSALISFQRVASNPEFESVGWHHLLEARVLAHPESWKGVRDLLLRTPMLSYRESILLLSISGQYWIGAETQPDIQESLGYLARQLASSPATSDREKLRTILTPALLRACDQVIWSNYLLARAVELSPAEARAQAYRWMTARPGSLNTVFLLSACLRSGLPPSDIEGIALAWLRQYSSTARASFLYRAWLDATQDAAPVRDQLLAWVNQHGLTPEARFVYPAWLDATKEAAPVRDQLLAWVNQHGLTPEAGFVYPAWLDATKEAAPVRDQLLAWVNQHGLTPEARFVYPAWLDATKEAAPVRDQLLAWVNQHGLTPEAGFVYSAWLDATKEAAPVRDQLLAWVNQHGLTPEAGFVYPAWLDATKEAAPVRDQLLAWVNQHGLTPEAGFVYPAWLDATKEAAPVRDQLLAWVNQHGLTLGAQFVYRAWLDATKEAAPVRGQLLAWVNQHGLTPEARFVYPAWLDATKEAAPVRDQLLAWVNQHGLTPEAGFVYPAWLDATKEAAPVRDRLLAWVNQHAVALKADFVYRAWLNATKETSPIRPSVKAWLVENAEYDDLDFVCRAWLNAGGEFELCKAEVFLWLERNWREYRAVYLLKNITLEPELPLTVISAVLGWCRLFPSDQDAVWRISRLEYQLQSPGLSEDFLSACELTLRHLFQTKYDYRTARCMVITLALLLTNPFFDHAQEERADRLFLDGLRQPILFLSRVLVTDRFQRSRLVTKFIDFVESNALKSPEDDERIERFIDWINLWSGPRKRKIRPLYDQFVARHPDGMKLWRRLVFPADPLAGEESVSGA